MFEHEASDRRFNYRLISDSCIKTRSSKQITFKNTESGAVFQLDTEEGLFRQWLTDYFNIADKKSIKIDWDT